MSIEIEAAQDFRNGDVAVAESLIAVKDAVRQLPPLAVKDLLSAAVCARCILRLLGIRGNVYSCPTLSPSLIYSLLEEAWVVDEPKSGEANGSFCGPETDHGPCNICLGILQFSYSNTNGMAVTNQSPTDMSSTIAEIVKKEGHDICDSLEISIPPIIMENEHAARLVFFGPFVNLYSLISQYRSFSLLFCFKIGVFLESYIIFVHNYEEK